jgi:hypothetical protein
VASRYSPILVPVSSTGLEVFRILFSPSAGIHDEEFKGKAGAVTLTSTSRIQARSGQAVVAVAAAAAAAAVDAPSGIGTVTYHKHAIYISLETATKHTSVNTK